VSKRATIIPVPIAVIIAAAIVLPLTFRSSSQASTANNGVPQSNGGIHDADNKGGPSDGDGNL
jgi:hypothetical protein